MVKILEVGIDDLTYAELSESGAPFIDSRIVVLKSDILLVEYKNGSVEIFNRPEKNSVITSRGMATPPPKKTENQTVSSNLIYFNTLALCNADFAGFYEHITTNKKIGFGLMAAYNFNKYATFSNLFIVPLANAKKNYDAGGFINFYPRAFKKRVTFSYGLLIKYTDFSFSKNTGTSTNVVYTATEGSQLATMVTIGTHSFLSKFLVLKTQIGIGGFYLRGDYKEEYNEIINAASPPGQQFTYNFLPKMYLGINLGFYL